MKHTQISNGSIKKQITFDPILYQLSKNQAGSLGLSLAEYIRHLLAKAIEERGDYIPMVDEATEKHIAASIKDYQEGRFEEIDLSDPKELSRAAGITP